MAISDQGLREVEAFSSVPHQARRCNVLLGISGSVAAIKLEELAEKLSKFAELKIVTTSAAKHFLGRYSKWGCKVIDDESEWHMWREKGDPVQHIELSQWADIFLIAPLSANTMAKMANGLCDNLLTCIVRAWNIHSPQKQIILAPAMNTLMWTNPLTAKHENTLIEIYKAQIITPIEKKLACGDIGIGALAFIDDICNRVMDCANELGFVTDIRQRSEQE